MLIVYVKTDTLGRPRYAGIRLAKLGSTKGYLCQRSYFWIESGPLQGFCVRNDIVIIIIGIIIEIFLSFMRVSLFKCLQWKYPIELN